MIRLIYKGGYKVELRRNKKKGLRLKIHTTPPTAFSCNECFLVKKRFKPDFSCLTACANLEIILKTSRFYLEKDD